MAIIEVQKPMKQLEYYKIFHILTASYLKELSSKGEVKEVIALGKASAGHIRDEYRSGGMIPMLRKTKYTKPGNIIYFLDDDVITAPKPTKSWAYISVIRNLVVVKKRELQKYYLDINEFDLVLVGEQNDTSLESDDYSTEK